MKTIKEIDEVVCQWSVDSGTAMTEEALNDLVDKIAALFGVPIPPNGGFN